MIAAVQAQSAGLTNVGVPLFTAEITGEMLDQLADDGFLHITIPQGAGKPPVVLCFALATELPNYIGALTAHGVIGVTPTDRLIAKTQPRFG